MAILIENFGERVRRTLREQGEDAAMALMHQGPTPAARQQAMYMREERQRQGYQRLAAQDREERERARRKEPYDQNVQLEALDEDVSAVMRILRTSLAQQVQRRYVPSPAPSRPDAPVAIERGESNEHLLL